jgi:hypothetical protein
MTNKDRFDKLALVPQKWECLVSFFRENPIFPPPLGGGGGYCPCHQENVEQYSHKIKISNEEHNAVTEIGFVPPAPPGW